MTRWSLVALAALTLAGCGREIVGTPGAVRSDVLGAGTAAGAVYTTNNAASANYVIIFARSSTGTLTLVDSVATGGKGSGPDPMFGSDPLASQDAVIISPNHMLLFVVNAGSNQVSSFRIGSNGALTLASVVPSGGRFPVSLSQVGDLLYVVNAKGDARISGFTVASGGSLVPLPGSTRLLPGLQPGPGSIRIAPGRSFVVVTERALNRLVLYPLNAGGLPGAPTLMPSPGLTPFGADFDESGHYILSEADVLPPRIPIPNASTVSSFAVSGTTLTVVSPSVPTTQTAACWIQTVGHLAFSSNTGSGSITSFSIGAGGALTRLNAQAGLTGPGTQPLDMAATNGFLYAVTAGDGGIHGFTIQSNGNLTPISAVTGVLPISVAGLAAF